MGGTPVFVGTRVPFQTLLDYLEGGEPLSEFLEDFPTVTPEQASPRSSRPRKPFSPVRILLDGGIVDGQAGDDRSGGRC